MKKTATILCLLFCMIFVNAQGIIKKVNDIKMSDDYIWAQYAHPSPDTALVKAKEWLAILVGEADGRQSIPQELESSVRHIFLKGETITRAFVYIKRADVHTQISSSDKSNDPEPEGNTFSPDSLTLNLMAQKDLYAVRDYFEDAQLQGSIARYGSPKDADSMDDKHLILFSQDNLAPICVLSPALEGTQRKNLLTGQGDSLDNHHRCYAIWYEIKKK